MSTEGDKNQGFLNAMASSLLQNSNSELTPYYRGLAAAGAALLGGAIYYYMNNSSSSSSSSTSNKVIDFNCQSKLAEGRTDGARIVTNNKTGKLLESLTEDGRTLYELFRVSEKKFGNNNYLGWKPSSNEPFKWLSYTQVKNISQQIGSAFIEFGLEPAKETFVGIFARNRVEWSLTEVACNSYSFVTVPLYDTLGAEAISFILMQTQLKLVVCDDSDKAIQLMNSKSSSLEYVIVIDNINDEARNKAKELNIKLYSFDECKQIGAKNIREIIAPNPDDLTTICYTSGTTGLPKGAMITHKNIVSIVSSVVYYLKGVNSAEEGNERYLSYLPLAHMFERCAHHTLVSLGGSVGFYQGDIKKIVDDLKEVKPTIFCTVPRLINRIYARISENLEKSSPLKKKIFNWAFSQKEKEVLRGVVRNNSIYDFAFKKIRETLGGTIKVILTGSAPVSPEILHFLRVVSGCYVIEGYGATETGGASSIQVPGETTVGNVGPPFQCCLYKLIDVPEMGLRVERDNRGEILVKGNNIFKGYFKDAEKTNAALDSDGWYHTGDIGAFTENGCLKIVDRVKNIFKLQQGEYIAPEKIENIYVRSKYVAQVFVYGNSYKSSLVSIIVPEEIVVYEWAKQNNIQDQDFASLCKNPELVKTVLKDITQMGKAGGLKGFEQVREIYLHHELFSIENGLITPTMKSKRNELEKYFKTQLDDLYKNLD